MQMKPAGMLPIHSTVTLKVSCMHGVTNTLTSEKFEDEHAAAYLLEDLIPNPASTLKAPLTDVQYVVAPEDPASHEVDEGKGQDDGAGGCICQCYYVDQHHDANLSPIPHAVWPQGCHFVAVRFWRPYND